MNQRIKLLAEQAGYHPDIFELCKPGFEKFAELIVAECAKEAFNYTWNEKNYEYYNDIGWDCLPGDLQSHIKEHFGVEE